MMTQGAATATAEDFTSQSSDFYECNNESYDDDDQIFHDDSDDDSDISIVLKQKRQQPMARGNALGHRRQGINVTRVGMMVTIVLIGIAMSVGVYQMLHRKEHAANEAVYIDLTMTLEQAITAKVQSMQQSVSNLAQAVTLSASLNEASSFPFVTVSMFDALAQQREPGVTSIMYAPKVAASQRIDWEQYALEHADKLMVAASALMEQSTISDATSDAAATNVTIPALIHPEPASSDAYYLPVWQVAPFSSNMINFNLRSALGETVFDAAAAASLDRLVAWTNVGMNASFTNVSELPFQSGPSMTQQQQQQQSFIVAPVYAATTTDAAGNDMTSRSPAVAVGFVIGSVAWSDVLSNLLPYGQYGVTVVLQNTCGSSLTFLLQQSKAQFIGIGDWHDGAYEHTAVLVPLMNNATTTETTSHIGVCDYFMTFYASNVYQASIQSGTPWTVTLAVMGVFCFLALAFALYDAYTTRRNQAVLATATRSQAILANLFPSNVRERLFAEKETEQPRKQRARQPQNLKALMNSGLSSMEGELDADMGYKGKPIADLFTESTVLFADIAGFTAWSSQREPAQVFTLLETLYRAFDEIAKRRRVFKVETIGDCYVAVTGVPEAQKDHAVLMCRFARDMMNKCHALTKRLETTLGPDTGDLDMRVGIHSGPVTAGVLRGERSRFQLFGDTMNTASRTESTGIRGKIQLSQDTADLLNSMGKSHWIIQREDKVFAKGKGEMTTFWLLMSKSDAASSSGDSDMSMSSRYVIKEVETRTVIAQMASEKTSRLVEWNCEVILRLLKQIASTRMRLPPGRKGKIDETKFMCAGTLAIDEVKEIISLPVYHESNTVDIDLDSVRLPMAVVDQVYDFVSHISALYRDNHFHNFEHASHVTMSVTKLLSRIVAPSDMDAAGKSLHDHTYGITSCPLTQFACIFSALIHDVDHYGIPNTLLVLGKTQLAAYYKNQSVAEQNSVDIAWHLLMDSSYADMRAAIYSTDEELNLFRALVVNSVMSTDIVDKRLKFLRNERWDKAFSKRSMGEDAKTVNDRKATIVIEHLIQASDVSHTMQHWHIYRKWNERFFFECWTSYCEGLTPENPADSWYKGEIGFFDFYIIPLAKKLKDCGVFGVASDEYLNYANRNRAEWQARGQEVVQEMLNKAQQLMEGPPMEYTLGMPTSLAPPEAAPDMVEPMMESVEAMNVAPACTAPSSLVIHSTTPRPIAAKLTSSQVMRPPSPFKTAVLVDDEDGAVSPSFAATASFIEPTLHSGAEASAVASTAALPSGGSSNHSLSTHSASSAFERTSSFKMPKKEHAPNEMLFL
ncbi:hypothetical protein MPSEU_000870300 [Mayamaea pseudoterrestris]|nr:hypothetical protein MPSEU_000870300 [Mayamaea pseudoterrestris]